MKPGEREQWLRQMRLIWEGRDTQELLSVWMANDRAEWTDDALDIIGQILRERLGRLPLQGPGPGDDEPLRLPPGFRLVLVSTAITVVILAQFIWWNHLRPNPYFQVLEDETRTILLTPPTSARQLVYEDEHVRVSIGYDWYLDRLAGSSRDTQDDPRPPQAPQEDLDRLDRAAGGVEVVPLDRYDDRWHIVAALEAGQAAVFDKRRGVSVTSIDMRTYGVVWCPVCGCGTRSFYLPGLPALDLRGVQFFEVIDWQY